MPSRIEGDHQFSGIVSFTNQVTFPAAAVTAANVKADARVETSKLQHRHSKHHSQGSGTTAADESKPIHVVFGATGTIPSFKAGCVVANIGDSTVTFDLKKNGSSVLSAPISFSSADAAYSVKSGTISSPNVVAGDVLEVVIDATVGTGTLATGAFSETLIDELAA